MPLGEFTGENQPTRHVLFGQGYASLISMRAPEFAPLNGLALTRMRSTRPHMLHPLAILA